MWRHLWNELVDRTSLAFTTDLSGRNRNQQYQGGLRFRLDEFVAKEITLPSK